MREHVLARHGEFGARRHGVDLRTAGQFELVHGVERLLDGRAAGQQPMIAHDQRVVRPEIVDDALALVEVDGRALIVVIADMADEPHRGLRQRQQPARHRRHRHAGAGVGVEHAGDVRPRLVDGAVDHVTGFVDAVVGVGLPDDLALDVDLDQARRGDLLVEHAVEIDEQMIVAAGNARRDVVVDEVGHPVLVDQAIAGGEVDARLPLLGRDLAADRLEVGRIVHG